MITNEIPLYGIIVEKEQNPALRSVATPGVQLAKLISLNADHFPAPNFSSYGSLKPLVLGRKDAKLLLARMDFARGVNKNNMSTCLLTHDARSTAFASPSQLGQNEDNSGIFPLWQATLT